MRSPVARFLVLLCLLFSVARAHYAAAQAGAGTIQGIVRDSSGAVIGGATVVAIDNATGVQVSRQATGEGYYSIAPLPAGEYSLRVTSMGFADTVQLHVTLNALQTDTVNLSLQPGSVDTTVNVSPSALNTADATLGDTVSNKDYGQLPLTMSGAPRDPTAFTSLSNGAATGLNGGTQYHSETYVEGMIFSTIDMQGTNNIGSTSLSVDAVEQSEVQTAGTSAEYQGQGLTNYVMKSGTNDLHGSAFEYFRNTALDSWNYFSKGKINAVTGRAIKPDEKQNEFGGTLGGPIVKNRIFYFASYEQMRYLSDPNPSLVTIPTLAQRKGDFRDLAAATGQHIYDPSTTVCADNICTRQPLTYNGVQDVIAPGRLSTVSQYLQKFLPAPSNGNVVNNYLSGYHTGFNYYKASGKLDAALTDRQHIGVIFMTGQRAPNPTDGSGLPIPYVSTTATTTTDNAAVLSHTYTIRPNLVNEVKYGFLRYYFISADPASGGEYASSAAGITGLPAGNASDRFPAITFSGLNSPLSWDTNNQPRYRASNNFALQDNLQWVLGRHSLNIGAQQTWYQYNRALPITGTDAAFSISSTTSANFVPNTSTVDKTLGSAYASFLLGDSLTANASSLNNVATTGGRFWALSPYVQDSYRLTDRLTLALGLRWDLYSPQTEVGGRESFLNPNTPNPIALGATGALEFAGYGPYSCHCDRPISIWLKNVGPRFGLAFLLTPKTVLRGSYGIAYTHGGGTGGRNGATDGTGQLGFSTSTSLSYADGYTPGYNWSNAFPSVPAGPVFDQGYGTGYTTSKGYVTPKTITYADPYLSRRSPYYENITAGIQHSLTDHLTLSVDYASSFGHFLPTSEGRGSWSNQIRPEYLALGSLLSAPATAANLAKANRILPVTLPFINFATNNTASIGQALRPFPQYGSITDIWGNIANSNYNSVQISLKQQNWKGLTYTVNYTYSKLIDDEGSTPTAYNLSVNRQISSTNRPQSLRAYGSWSIPATKSSRLTSVLARDWTVSAIYTYISSAPLVYTGSSCSAPYTGTCLPSYASGFSGSARLHGAWGHGVTASNAAISYINKSAFTNPAAYSLGNLPSTNAYKITGPSSPNLDISLRRSVPIQGRWRLTLQADAFNALNQVVFGGINTTVGSASFGQVSTQANSARDVQLAAHINF